MKYLALDLGKRRVGVAVSDDTGIIAKPHAILEFSGNDVLIDTITELCTQKNIGSIVVGIPYSAPEHIQNSYRTFIANLAERTGLPVNEWDETFSTKQAQNMVAFADQPSTRKRTRTHRDDVAAAVILQEFLDHEHSKSRSS
ncbi:MAG: Holliday junction resolvase RuvX [Candidatus Dojkabacteria bacterium]|nr:Holliday junction resolvase RuvX [Candidatus Dojkabacteria bacterium]